MKNFIQLFIVVCFMSFGMNSAMAQVQSQSKQTFKSIQGDQMVELTIENDEVTELKIDGYEVPAEQYDDYQDIVDSVRSGKTEGIHGNSNFDQQFNFPDGFDMNIDSLLEGFGGMGFDFDQMPDMDSLMNGFDMNMFNLGDMDQGNMNEMLEEIMKSFGGGESFNFDDDFMKNLEKQMEGLSQIMPEGFDMEGFNFDTNESFGLQKEVEDELLMDRLIEDKSKYEFDLSGKELKINGEKQDEATWLKYKNLYEDNTGTKLDKNSNIQFHKNSDTQDRSKEKKPKTYRM